MMCIKGTVNVDTAKGNCPEDCEYGGWNSDSIGRCGWQCLEKDGECGGCLYETELGLYCSDEHKIVDLMNW